MELDGKPALPLYRSYLGDLADGLPAAALFFPLCIRPADDSAEPLVRTVLGVDNTDNSMTFAGDIPEGWRAQLMMSNPEDLVDAAAEAAGDSIRGRQESPDLSTTSFDSLALAVSCVGRRLVLGSAADDELLDSLIRAALA